MINPQKGYLHIPMIFSHIEQAQGNVNRWTLRSAQFIAKVWNVMEPKVVSGIQNVLFWT
jgi:hypothetical protein